MAAPPSTDDASRDAAQPPAEDAARSAGRGGLAVLAAKLFFIGTGLIQQTYLPRAIGLADYGVLSRVSAVSNVFNNVLVASSTQGVSRTVASAPGAEREALRATFRVHAVLALAASAILLVASPFVAHFQSEHSVLAPLCVMTGVLAIYGVYAPLVGYINGRRMFSRQATLDMVAATLRTIGLLGVGALFVRYGAQAAAGLSTSPGVLGAAVGSVGAAVGVFALALFWTGTGTTPRGSANGVPSVTGYLALIGPVMLGQLFTNGLMQADIFLLGRYLSLAAPEGFADSANEWVGVYRACQLFAFLPYQLLFSVTQVLFPMLARAKTEEGPARVAELVSRGARIGTIACGMLVAVIVAAPESLIQFAYGAVVASRGAATLRILALGQACFAILSLATTILVSLGKERQAMGITAMTLGLLIAFCSVMIPSSPFGEAQLHTAAIATSSALLLAVTIATVATIRTAGAFVPWKTALRVGGCIVAASLLGRGLPVFPKLITPFVSVGCVTAYLAALALTGELGKQDLALVFSILRRRPNP